MVQPRFGAIRINTGMNKFFGQRHNKQLLRASGFLEEAVINGARLILKDLVDSPL
jgi:hypothetical protein